MVGEEVVMKRLEVGYIFFFLFNMICIPSAA